MTFKSDVLAGQIALVTGGTRGIGEAIASQLAAHGAAVTAVGRGAGAEARQLDQGSLKYVTADVARQDSVDQLFAGFQSLDIVVNCAGILHRGEEHDVEVFRRVIEVNLTGTMRVCAGARPLLAQTRGCIVNIASMLTFLGGGLVPAYSASKGGVGQLTKSLAIAYAADGIRVNAVAPGWIATSLTKDLQKDPVRNAAILGRTPLGRWGTGEDVAKAVVFLCAPAASFITGTIVPVDGGYLAT